MMTDSLINLEIKKQYEIHIAFMFGLICLLPITVDLNVLDC